MHIQKLEEILTPLVISVSPETMIDEALQLMRVKSISCIIVLQEANPVGIVTERNIVKAIARQPREFANRPIREIMSSPVITAPRGMDIFEAYNLLSTRGVRHLAVVDEALNLVGVVTLSNIVEHLSYESFVELKRVSQVMTRVISTVSRQTSVRQALVAMADNSLSCIVVADGRKPVGIITERDASRLLIDSLDLDRLTVAEVMTSDLQTVYGDASLAEAVDIMKRRRLRRLVVVDRQGNIEGLTTQSDIVRGLEGKYIQALNELIREKDDVIQTTSRDLAEKTVYLDNILRSSVDYGMLAVDLNQRVVFFNPGAEQLLGVGAAAVLGRDLRAIHQHCDTLLARVNKAMDAIRQGERPCFIIERQHNGAKRFLNATASGMVDRQGELAGFFLMLSDITERKQAEEALRKAHDELEHRVELRTRELSRAMNGTIEAMALMVEMRDPYTSGHQRRVADLAAAIARQLGLPADKIEGIYMAGLIHDIGMVCVPTSIICRPGRLNEIELGLVRPHPETGNNILKGIEFPWPVAAVVHQHHERLDGSGYPLGLKGDAILGTARILAVADVVEALSSHRPYRPAFGLDQALAEIIGMRGITYDADVVDACVALFRKHAYAFPGHAKKQSGQTVLAVSGQDLRVGQQQVGIS
ncbi:MAG: hypothetical protein A2521_12810 [Deltaproteobacteria bacterium RIFOXYD12_FULL_57_12]|nr:MAG: hypothetical protein A2521_12810 [Deltaproteobacteria bacterium RIFOXYD12_FULL_57_12]